MVLLHAHTIEFLYLEPTSVPECVLLPFFHPRSAGSFTMRANKCGGPRIIYVPLMLQSRAQWQDSCPVLLRPIRSTLCKALWDLPFARQKKGGGENVAEQTIVAMPRRSAEETASVPPLRPCGTGSRWGRALAGDPQARVGLGGWEGGAAGGLQGCSPLGVEGGGPRLSGCPRCGPIQ